MINSEYWDRVYKFMDDASLNPAWKSASDDEVFIDNLASRYAREFQRLGDVTSVCISNYVPEILHLNNSLSRRLHMLSLRHWQLLSRIPICGDLVHRSFPVGRKIRQALKLASPDVVIVLNPNLLTPSLVRFVTRRGALLVGQIASPLPPKGFFKHYDWMVSALPSQVEYFKTLGIDADYLPLSIGEDSISHNPTLADRRTIDVAFVGSIGRHHKGSRELLRAVAKSVPGFRIYSASKGALRRLGLEQYSAGPVFGRDMLDVYRSSKIVLNRHIDVANGFAANMRMYEATISGAVLLTESAPNLSDLFEPGTEVVTYRDAKSAVETILDLLADTERMDSIGEAGRKRTETQHLTKNRVYFLRGRLKGLLESRAKVVREIC